MRLSPAALAVVLIAGCNKPAPTPAPPAAAPKAAEPDESTFDAKEVAAIHAVYDRAKKALTDKDWASLWECCPPDGRELLLADLTLAVMQAAGTSGKTPKGPEDFLALLRRHGAPEKPPKAGKNPLPPNALKAAYAGVGDEAALFADIMAWMGHNRAIPSRMTAALSGAPRVVSLAGDASRVRVRVDSGATAEMAARRIGGAWYIQIY